MSRLNNSKLETSTIRVQLVKRDPNARRAQQSRGGNVFVSGLPHDPCIDSESLGDSFAFLGTILSSRVFFDVDGKPAFGYVHFADRATAQQAEDKVCPSLHTISLSEMEDRFVTTCMKQLSTCTAADGPFRLSNKIETQSAVLPNLHAGFSLGSTVELLLAA